MATRIPLDVLAAVFTHDSMGVRDVGAARLVCRHWRAAVDGVTVRQLAIRSPGPASCTVLLLRRFPLLQSLCLGSAVTSSNRAAFAAALSSVQALSGQLTRLSLEFACAAAVHLPSCLHSLTRLRSLTVSVGTWQPGLGQGLSLQGPGRPGGPLGAAVAAATVVARAGISADGGRRSIAVDDPTDDGDDAVVFNHAGGYGSGPGSLRELSIPASGYGGVGGVLLSGGGDGRSMVPVRIPPAGLIPLLSSLSCLASLELVHITISVPEILCAVQSAATAPAAVRTGAAGRAGRGLRRLVLVGSCVNLTGVDAPEVAAQLAGLEVLCIDGCTGADALMPLLPYLTALKRLDLAGMDYTWAAAAGYHRRAGFNSANDLMQHVNHLDNGNQLPNHHVNANVHNVHNGIAVGGGVGNAGLIDNVDEGNGGAAAAAASALAAAAGRPLSFLLCLPRLQSLNLAGSFLRTLPNRDISGLTGLMALDLSGNGIDDLPPGLTLLPLLRRLDVSNNELLTLPNWLAQMQSLECISCHHNSLERFPTLLYELTRLSYLAVGHNRISWWPVECVLPRHRPPPLGAAAAGGGMPPPQQQHPRLPLVSLDLSHNRLFGLPGGLAWLASLRCLRLRDSLAGLDQSGTARAMALLAGLTGLWELDLSSNHLDQHSIVPLSELRDLRRLWLSDNGLEELPLGLAQLSCLTLLSLRANRFSEVPVCLRWLSCLEALDLSCNRLAELPPWIGSSNTSNTPGNMNASATGVNDNANASSTSARGASTCVTKADTCAVDTETCTTNIDAGDAAAGSGAHPHPPNLHHHHYQHPRPSQHSYKVGKPLGSQLYFRVTPPIRQQLPQQQLVQQGGQQQQQQQQQQGQQISQEHPHQHEHQHRHQHRHQQQQEEKHPEEEMGAHAHEQRHQQHQNLQQQDHGPQTQTQIRTHHTSETSSRPCNLSPPTHQSHPQDPHPTDQPGPCSQQGHGKQGHGSHAGHSQLGLVGLRHLDVSQQYSVVVRESAVPDIPPRLEVQPPHCLYGPLQGDLPEELLRLPLLRTLVLQRHMLRVGSRVLRRLQMRGVEVIHPRPLRVESLPGAAAAALNTAAAAGGLLFPGHHPELRAIAQAAIAGGGGGGGGDFLLGGGGGIGPAVVNRRTAGFLRPRESLLLLSLVVLTPVAVAIAASVLGLPPPPHVVMLVVVAAATRLALSAILLGREAQRRQQRQRDVAAAAAAAVQPPNGDGGAAAGAAGH